MLYVICYDISSTKRRNKIFKTLKNYGEHKQFSVFECDISQRQLKKLVCTMEEIMKDEEEWSIRIYSLCEKCREKISALGENQETEDVIILG